MRYILLILLLMFAGVVRAQNGEREQKGFVIDIDSSVRIWMPGKHITSASETDFPLKKRIVMSQAAMSNFGVLKYSAADVMKMLAKRKVKLTKAFTYAVEHNLQDSVRTVVFDGRVQELLNHNGQVTYQNGTVGDHLARFVHYRPNRAFKTEYTAEVLIYLNGNLYNLNMQGTDGYDEEAGERLFKAMLESFGTTTP